MTELPARVKVRQILLSVRRPLTSKTIAAIGKMGDSAVKHALAHLEHTGQVVKFRQPGSRKLVFWSAVPPQTQPVNKLVVSAAELLTRIGDEEPDD